MDACLLYRGVLPPGLSVPSQVRRQRRVFITGVGSNVRRANDLPRRKVKDFVRSNRYLAFAFGRAQIFSHKFMVTLESMVHLIDGSIAHFVWADDLCCRGALF